MAPGSCAIAPNYNTYSCPGSAIPISFTVSGINPALNMRAAVFWASAYQHPIVSGVASPILSGIERVIYPNTYFCGSSGCGPTPAAATHFLKLTEMAIPSNGTYSFNFDGYGYPNLSPGRLMVQLYSANSKKMANSTNRSPCGCLGGSPVNCSLQPASQADICGTTPAVSGFWGWQETCFGYLANVACSPTPTPTKTRTPTPTATPTNTPTITNTPTPTPTLGMPSALWASCQNNATQATVGWTAGANADAYYLRVDNQNNPWPDIPGGDVYEDNVVATSYDLPVTPDAPYSFWVHSRYDTGEFSAAEISSFFCATPPTPTPTAVATPTIVPGIVITGILSQQSGSSTTTIDTNGTDVATDDTYGTSASDGTHPIVNGPDATDPAIITHQWTDSNGYIFISTWGSGLYLINSQNTLGTEDDTLVKVYSTLSSPPIASDLVYGSWLATTAPFTSQLYINTNGGLSVLNIGSVNVTNDDVVVGRYSTSSSPNGTPNIPSNHIRRSNMVIVEAGVGGPGGAYIYISTDTGLLVIDTQATTQTSDDVLLYTYNSTSVPTLGTNDVNVSLYISQDALYVGTANGLAVIDIGSGISSLADDTITTHSLIPNGTAVNDLVYVTSTNTLYVATENGLYVIDTNGTDTTADDVLVHVYTTTSGAGEGEPIVLINNNVNDIEYDPATDTVVVVTDPITRPIGNEVSLPSANLTIIPRPTTYYYPNIADGPCSSASTSINTGSNPQSFTSTIGLSYNPQTGAPCVVQDPSVIGFDILTTILGYYNTLTLSNVQVASPNTTYNFDIPLSYSGGGDSWIKIVNGSFIRAPNKSTLTNTIPFVADRFLSGRSTQANIGTGDDDTSDTDRAVFIDETSDFVAGVVTEVDMAPVAKRSPTNNWFVTTYDTNTSLGANLTSYVAKLINKKSVNEVVLSDGTLTLAAGQINNLVQADATIDSLVISGTSNRGTVLVVSQDALGALANVTFSNNFNTTNPRKSLVIFAKNITVGGATSDFGAVFIGTGTFSVNTRDDNGTTFLPSAVPLKISGDVIMSGGISQNRKRVRADYDNARPAMIIVSIPKMIIDTFALLAISE